jgi:putative spermidine/putrescine transport system permease protein
MPLRGGLLLSAPALLLLCVFFVAPLVYGIVLSVAGSPVTLSRYARIVTDAYYLKVLASTFALGAGVTVISAVLGYPCAYFIARSRGPWANLVVLAVITPLAVSIVMRSFGWIALLGREGIISVTLRSLGVAHEPRLLHDWPGLTIALVHVLLPYMILSISSVLSGIAPELEEAAQTLGASRWKTFARVTLPLSFDGIGTGAILVFMLAIGGFVTALLVGGENTMILPLLVYQQISLTNDYGFAAALGNVLLVVALAVLWLQMHFLRTRGRG